MGNLYEQIVGIDVSAARSKTEVLQDCITAAKEYGYEAVDINDTKPWGAYVRFDTKDADDFIACFFPGHSSAEARLGDDTMELSPKFLLVDPGKRLSWQRHSRRAERWAYITDGAYYKSADPANQGEQLMARAGEIVQFEKGECHRLVGLPGSTYTLVAEIWQHTNPSEPSDEADIERLADDFNR